MKTYTKPVLKALSEPTESCGCNFFINDAGEGVYIYTEGLPGPGQGELNPGAALHNNVASVGDGHASVTPLANTGLPGTQPIIIGAPVGVTGVSANIGPGASNTAVGFDASAFSLHVLSLYLDPF